MLGAVTSSRLGGTAAAPAQTCSGESLASEDAGDVCVERGDQVADVLNEAGPAQSDASAGSHPSSRASTGADGPGTGTAPPEFASRRDGGSHSTGLVSRIACPWIPGCRTTAGARVSRPWELLPRHKRHGTTTLVAALEVATRQVQTDPYARRRRREFLDFMNEVLAAHPDPELEIHVVLANLSTHKPKHDRWLARHERLTPRPLIRRSWARDTPGPPGWEDASYFKVHRCIFRPIGRRRERTGCVPRAFDTNSPSRLTGAVGWAGGSGMSMSGTQSQMLARRRMLAVSALALGAAVVTAVTGCADAESGTFNFKPVGVGRGGGGEFVGSTYNEPPPPLHPTPTPTG